MEIAEIIAELEKAKTGSRKLDVSIWTVLYAPAAFVLESPFNGEWCAYLEDNPKGRLVPEPLGVPRMTTSFTTSIDAALTLVPRGFAFQVKRMITGDAEAFVYGHDAHETGDANTPALALCIAALKARSANPQHTVGE